MKDWLKRLLRATVKATPFLIGLIVVKVKAAHIGADIGHASVPNWLTEAVNARLADGLTWPELGVIAALVLVGAITALASFFWSDIGEALYDGWLIHEIRELWKKRPWKRNDQSPKGSDEQSDVQEKKNDGSGDTDT